MSRKSLKTLIIASWVGVFGLIAYSPYLVPKKLESKHLSILTWSDILDSSVIQEFEKTYDVKVHMSYYASNEELLVKMKATEGVGYDILVPSDYAVAKLIENNLIQPLDKTQIPHFAKVDPLLLNQFYDRGNIYSLPFEWELFGFGYNKNKLNLSTCSWDLLFNTDLDFKFVMSNDPNEALQFASFYLFGPKTKLSNAELLDTIQLLSASRKRTEAYASFRSDYFLATGSVPLVVASSSYIWRSLKQFPFLGFKIPDEGSFLTIENICLSKSSKNSDLAHKFINFITSDKSMKQHFETFSFFPSTLWQIDDVAFDAEAKALIDDRENLFKKLRFIGELASQEKIQDAWVKIKVSSLP